MLYLVKASNPHVNPPVEVLFKYYDFRFGNWQYNIGGGFLTIYIIDGSNGIYDFYRQRKMFQTANL